MVAALVASIIPFVKSYGMPHGWAPDPATLWRMARRNIPVAAADAVEWGSRRIDIAVLGPVLLADRGRHLLCRAERRVAPGQAQDQLRPDPRAGDRQAICRTATRRRVAKQVRQVGFWVIAAQIGVALALAIPGEAVMGLVGPAFVAGTAALAFLLAAEVVAAMAAVSEAALIYVARHRNMLISFVDARARSWCWRSS